MFSLFLQKDQGKAFDTLGAFLGALREEYSKIGDGVLFEDFIADFLYRHEVCPIPSIEDFDDIAENVYRAYRSMLHFLGFGQEIVEYFIKHQELDEILVDKYDFGLPTKSQLRELMKKDDLVHSPLFAMPIQQAKLFAIAEILVNRLDLFQTTESVHSVAAFLAGNSPRPVRVSFNTTFSFFVQKMMYKGIFRDGAIKTIGDNCMVISSAGNGAFLDAHSINVNNSKIKKRFLKKDMPQPYVDIVNIVDVIKTMLISDLVK